MPKGIQVEEGFMAEGAHQPHAQVYSPDMGEDSGTWGGWALFATFHLALIHPFGAPQLYSEGLHVHQDIIPSSWSSSCWGRHSGRAYRIQSFRLCGLLRGLGMNWGTGADAGSGGERFGWERVERWSYPPQEPIQTLCFGSCNGLPQFSPPLCLYPFCFCLPLPSFLPLATGFLEQSQPLQGRRKRVQNNQR